MSVATASGQTGTGSQSPTSGSSGDENATSAPPHAATRKMVSSHYAQISPLRGQGLPHPSVMGIQNTGQNSALAESSVKSYFQVNIWSANVLKTFTLNSKKLLI